MKVFGVNFALHVLWPLRSHVRAGNLLVPIPSRQGAHKSAFLTLFSKLDTKKIHYNINNRYINDKILVFFRRNGTEFDYYKVAKQLELTRNEVARLTAEYEANLKKKEVRNSVRILKI